MAKKEKYYLTNTIDEIVDDLVKGLKSSGKRQKDLQRKDKRNNEIFKKNKRPF